MSDKIFTSSEQRRLEALVSDDEPSAEEIYKGVKQGLCEALRSEYVSLEVLWADDE